MYQRLCFQSFAEYRRKNKSRSTMEFDQILAKCGNNGRYQYMLLGFFGYIGFISTLQFFAQNVISSVPEHWCYHEKLENKTYAEIAEVYKNFERPSCTRLETIDDNGNVTISSKPCDRWIYKYDFGFRGMNIEVGVNLILYSSLICNIFNYCSTTGYATRPIKLEWVSPFTFSDQ